MANSGILRRKNLEKKYRDDWEPYSKPYSKRIGITVMIKYRYKE